MTTNAAATIKVIDTAAGSSQPSEATFAGVGAAGSSVAFTPFANTISGQSASTTRRKWYQAGDGATFVYHSVDVTTLAASNAISSINGGNPIREGQTGIVGVREGGATGTTSTVWNGVAQANHTVIDDTTWTFDYVWPNLMYNETANIAVGGVSLMSPPHRPPVGADFVTLAAGFAEATAGTQPCNPDAVAGDQYGYMIENGIQFDTMGRVRFPNGFDGTVSMWVVDQADRSRSAAATRYFAGAVDDVPDAPTFADFINQNPGVRCVRTWVLDNIDTTIDVLATGAALVSLNGTDWLTSVQGGAGTSVQVGVLAPALGQPANVGGAVSNGVGDSFSVAVRAANAPTITTQPVNSNPVTAGVNAVFTAAFTGAASIQWYNAANNSPISGATAATLSYPTNSGHAGQTLQFYARGTSSEGGTVQTNTVSVSVIAAATRLVIPAGLQTGRGQNLAGQQVTINVRADVSGKAGAIVYTTTLPIAASGPTNIDNNQNGTIGTPRWIGLTSSVDNTEALYPATVVSAA